jgi:DNA-binding transcriptional LysR family regulator
VLSKAGIDMAIRVESPKDSDLIYRKLAPNQLVLCAAPDYLRERGSIREIADLNRHDLLMLSIHHRCRLAGTDVQLGEFASRKRITCENGALLTDMALDGGGVLVRSIWDVQEHLQCGRLVQVLPQSPLETFGHIYAVIPSKKYLAPRVRVFFDFVLAHAAQWTIDGRSALHATDPLTELAVPR